MDTIILKLSPKHIFNYVTHQLKKIYTKQKIKEMKLGFFGKNSILGFPSTITNPSHVYIHDYAIIQQRNIIYNYTGKFIIKEYSVASIDLLAVTGNHISTVGIPFRMLAESHINDKETDIIIEEDVWIGARVTLLAGSHIGRGAIIGANSLVNKDIPPYAVAVGSPCHIIGSKFTIEQIIEHEKILYPEDKRFSKAYLIDLFGEYYKDKKNNWHK